jgi:hypothetical protein
MEKSAGQSWFASNFEGAGDSVVISEYLESEMDSAREDEDQSLPPLNDSEASNIAFILSDRFSRNADWNISLDMEGGEIRMEEFARKVALRLEELSLRLGDDHDAKKIEGSGL